MVFNKEKEIPHKAAGAGKGAVQHCIKTYCDVEKGENSHSSYRGNVHASVSTNSQLLPVCVVCVCVCVRTHRHVHVLSCNLSHWCVVWCSSSLPHNWPGDKMIMVRLNHSVHTHRDRLCSVKLLLSANAGSSYRKTQTEVLRVAHTSEKRLHTGWRAFTFDFHTLDRFGLLHKCVNWKISPLHRYFSCAFTKFFRKKIRLSRRRVSSLNQ